MVHKGLGTTAQLFFYTTNLKMVFKSSAAVQPTKDREQKWIALSVGGKIIVCSPLQKLMIMKIAC